MGRPTKVCKSCGEVFERNPKYGKAQWARAEFCSNTCRGSTLAVERQLCECGCGEHVSKPRSRWKPGHNTHPERQVVWSLVKVGGGMRRWVVHRRKGKPELWARVVMRNVIGRELRPGEVVHHINHDSADDRPENLRLYESHADHMRAEHAPPGSRIGINS